VYKQLKLGQCKNIILVQWFPEIEIMAKYHQLLIFIKGMGAHVKKTVIKRKNFLPQISDSAPEEQLL